MEQQSEYLPAELPKITQKEIDDFLFASGTKLTEQQKAMFYQVSHINGLNPFKREVYAIPYGDRFNIITGYEVYIKRGERTGKLDGWEADYISDPKGDYAFCTIYRKDQSHPVTQKVWLKEFDLGNKMWKEKPKAMLIKVAIATAFRRAFPEEVGGLPYTSDEIPLEGEVIRPIKAQIEKPKQTMPVDTTTGEIVEPEPPQEARGPFLEFYDGQDEQSQKLIDTYIESLKTARVNVIGRANKNIEGFKTKFQEWLNA